MLGLSHAPLILVSALALNLSIPSDGLRPRVFISPLPFRFTSALTFSLASATVLIIYIPLASTLTLDLMESLAVCVIYFALASSLAFSISKASVLALVLVETLVLSAFTLILDSYLSPSTFFLVSSLFLAPTFTEALSLSIPSASDLALVSAAAL